MMYGSDRAGAGIREDRVGERDVHEGHLAGAKVGGGEPAEIEQLARPCSSLPVDAGEAGVLARAR